MCFTSFCGVVVVFVVVVAGEEAEDEEEEEDVEEDDGAVARFPLPPPLPLLFLLEDVAAVEFNEAVDEAVDDVMEDPAADAEFPREGDEGFPPDEGL